MCPTWRANETTVDAVRDPGCFLATWRTRVSPLYSLHRFPRLHFVRRSHFRKTRRGGDAVPPPPPAKRLSNPGTSPSPSDTAIAVFWGHDPRERGEQPPSCAINRPRPRGEHPSRRHFFIGAPLRRNGTRWHFPAVEKADELPSGPHLAAGTLHRSICCCWQARPSASSWSLLCARVNRHQMSSQAGGQSNTTVQPSPNHSHVAWNCDVSHRLSKSS